MAQQRTTLEIERFPNEKDELEFRIASKREMRNILQNIADQKSNVALFYGGSKNFVLSMVLGANEHGVWLDVGPYPPDNQHLLASKKIAFVGFDRSVKVQFETNNIESDMYENAEAFYVELPAYLLRIQRREYFRVTVPSNPPVKCLIPIPAADPNAPPEILTAHLVNISGDGVGLKCEENETRLPTQSTFKNCKIVIPDTGALEVALEIRSTFKVTKLNNAAYLHVGCHFIRPDNATSQLLQRYIARLQSESIVDPGE